MPGCFTSVFSSVVLPLPRNPVSTDTWIGGSSAGVVVSSVIRVQAVEALLKVFDQVVGVFEARVESGIS